MDRQPGVRSCHLATNGIRCIRLLQRGKPVTATGSGGWLPGSVRVNLQSDHVRMRRRITYQHDNNLHDHDNPGWRGALGPDHRHSERPTQLHFGLSRCLWRSTAVHHQHDDHHPTGSDEHHHDDTARRLSVLYRADAAVRRDSSFRHHGPLFGDERNLSPDAEPE